jgi:murein DD-endopeptidase MepM/ murein hydrolase activator NlpD
MMYKERSRGADSQGFLFVLMLLTLVSCTTPNATQLPPVVFNPAVIPTSTALPPTQTPSSIPTAEQPCDPFQADFCITDGHFVFQRPIQLPANDRIDPSYRYGSTADGTRDPHHGVEFPDPSGTPVYAAAEGVVISAGPDQAAIYSPWQNFYGNLVVIEHASKLFTLYAHLSKVTVLAGQNVRAGDKVGEVGRTGVAIGSHLHFEVRQGNGQDYFATRNPELWLTPALESDGFPLGALMITIVNADGSLVPYAKLTIQRYTDHSESPSKSYYLTTYSADMLNSEENAALGELSPGRYRVAVDVNGQILERWVEVKSGKLTRVVLMAN